MRTCSNRHVKANLTKRQSLIVDLDTTSLSRVKLGHVGIESIVTRLTVNQADYLLRELIVYYTSQEKQNELFVNT